MKKFMICLMVISSFLGCASQKDDTVQTGSILNGSWQLDGYNANSASISIDNKSRFVLTDNNGLIQAGTLYNIGEKGIVQPGYFATAYVGTIALKFDNGASEKFVYEINNNRNLSFRRY